MVDDELNLLNLMSTFLKSQGYEVVTASDGYGGFAAFVASKPDLVILDYQMPAGTGGSVLERIRSTDRGALLPVILLSSLPTFQVEMNILLDKTHLHFMQKPADFAVLQALLAQLTT